MWTLIQRGYNPDPYAAAWNFWRRAPRDKFPAPKVLCFVLGLGATRTRPGSSRLTYYNSVARCTRRGGLQRKLHALMTQTRDVISARHPRQRLYDSGIHEAEACVINVACSGTEYGGNRSRSKYITIFGYNYPLLHLSENHLLHLVC